MVTVGSTPVVYFQPIPHQLKVTKKVYFFNVQHAVCLAYVEDADLNTVLNVRGGCCGQRRTGIYRKANDAQVRVWETGQR